MTPKILKLTLAFLSSRFPPRPKKSLQKIKFLRNETGILDEIKTLFKQIKSTFLERKNSTLREADLIQNPKNGYFL